MIPTFTIGRYQPEIEGPSQTWLRLARPAGLRGIATQAIQKAYWHLIRIVLLPWAGSKKDDECNFLKYLSPHCALFANSIHTFIAALIHHWIPGPLGVLNFRYLQSKPTIQKITMLQPVEMQILQRTSLASNPGRRGRPVGRRGLPGTDSDRLMTSQVSWSLSLLGYQFFFWSHRRSLMKQTQWHEITWTVTVTVTVTQASMLALSSRELSELGVRLDLLILDPSHANFLKSCGIDP